MRLPIRTIIGILIILLFVSQPVSHVGLSLLERLENFTYDARLEYTAPFTVDKNIVILDIDEKSLTELGHWPWSRNILANLVDTLFDHYDINVIGFDIVFAEEDIDPGLGILNNMAEGELKSDKAFLKAYKQALPLMMRDQQFAASLANRKTVMGFTFISENDLPKNSLPKPSLELPPEITQRLQLYQQISYTANLTVLQDNAQTGGFIDNPSIVYDADGVFRRVPLLQMHDSKIYESLAFATFRSAIGSPPIELIYQSGDDDVIFLDWLKVGDYKIPVDQETNVLVPYRGYWQSFPYISVIDVLNKTEPIDSLKDAIILMGTSAAGLKDLRTTPFETGYPGVEVHANIISGIIEDRIKDQPSYTFILEFLLLLTLGVVLTYIYPRLSALSTSLTTMGILAALVFGNLFAWTNLNLVLPLANSLLLVVSLFVLHMSYGFFVESREKRQITRLFGQYVPPELVDELSEHPDQLSLEGETREMSVLFSDVRNFTTISENLDPKQITQLINGFLTPMTEIIHKHRGTIDKYMGDAIMAFWGAPLNDPDHARNTLLAGMEMLREIKNLYESFEQRGWPKIHIGVGINSGPMNVGNMGSEFRMAYTVLGDTVNLGSRLEGLTKVYGVEIIVSEFTKEAVPDYVYRELDKVRVKGKDHPVTIYEPLGPQVEISPELRDELHRYNQALELFRQQQWDAADQAFQILIQDHPDKLLYKLYRERIEIYRTHPPGENWDGSFTHKSK